MTVSNGTVRHSKWKHISRMNMRLDWEILLSYSGLVMAEGNADDAVSTSYPSVFSHAPLFYSTFLFCMYSSTQKKRASPSVPILWCPLEPCLPLSLQSLFLPLSVLVTLNPCLSSPFTSTTSPHGGYEKFSLASIVSGSKSLLTTCLSKGCSTNWYWLEGSDRLCWSRKTRELWVSAAEAGRVF